MTDKTERIAKDVAVDAIIKVALIIAEKIEDEVQKKKMLDYIKVLKDYIRELETALINRDEISRLLAERVQELEELITQT